MIRPNALVLALVLAGPLTSLAGQDKTAATALAGRPMVSMRVSGVPQLLAAWPNTVVGKLAADEEVAEAVQRVIAFTQRQLARNDAIMRAAVELGVELPPAQMANYMTQPDMFRFFEHPVEQLRSAELLALLPEGDRRICSTPG